MKVAIIHYHLRTGGVSRVVADQSAALSACGIAHLIISAGPEAQDLPHTVIPELDYCRETELTAEALLEKMREACQATFGGPPDLWHFHNPTLGKHLLFPKLIALLSAANNALVLQIHDFVEDNRPENYALLGEQKLYPVAPQIHYAFLNRRDQSSFTKIGLAPSQSHLLPNIVQAQDIAEGRNTHGSGKALVLYPVRGIRRKNIGEVLLLAALSPPGTRFAISLAPENEQWRQQYNRWQELAAELALPILFDVTNRESPSPSVSCRYQDWQQHATHFLTTSVGEGFGLTFLEPLAISKPLLGRDLPEITCDFRSHGIEHPFLYQRLPIPLTELDSAGLKTTLGEAMQSLYQKYGQTLSRQDLAHAWNHLTERNQIDFGNLPESFQENLIREACHPETADSHLFPHLREWLHKVLADRSLRTHSAGLTYYSAEKGQERLLTLYQKVLASPPAAPSWLDRELVLEQFLHPRRFHFLRS